MDGPLVHPRTALVHGRRFVNTTTVGGPIIGPTSVLATETFIPPPRVTSLAISVSVTVCPQVPAISPKKPVPNPVVSVPTTSYTGQALLTHTCAVPQYTAIEVGAASYEAVPVVGCAQQNAKCCPPRTKSSKKTASVIPLGHANSALISALNAQPLVLCPADYTSTARHCCPV
jgi:hypothetical protein